MLWIRPVFNSSAVNKGIRDKIKWGWKFSCIPYNLTSTVQSSLKFSSRSCYWGCWCWCLILYKNKCKKNNVNVFLLSGMFKFSPKCWHHRRQTKPRPLVRRLHEWVILIRHLMDFFLLFFWNKQSISTAIQITGHKVQYSKEINWWSKL